MVSNNNFNFNDIVNCDLPAISGAESRTSRDSQLGNYTNNYFWQCHYLTGVAITTGIYVISGYFTNQTPLTGNFWNEINIFWDNLDINWDSI